jgi:GntR family transcriptional regulator, carbon starvation induced regulator
MCGATQEEKSMLPAKGAAGQPPADLLSRADLAERELRQAILTGVLGPGTRLQPGDIATQLQLRLSPTPLREALLRLRERGLVDISPNRGARVAELSAAELGELYELRLMLEPMAVERSVRAGDGLWQAEVRQRVRDLQHVGQHEPYAVLDDAHRALHNALMSRCGSAWLLNIVDVLADNSSRYRAAAGRALGRRSGAGSARHHQPLVAACLAGDAALAATLSREHIAEMLDAARESIGAGPTAGD